MSNSTKLFIVEGEDRDYRFVKQMTNCFFSEVKFDAKIIALPAARNIYMLYQQLVEDHFDSDIVELLRDTVASAKKVLAGLSRQDIDEVYLFFDYDVHQNNLSYGSALHPEQVLRSMFAVFNNETENGKLYLSYPMVEALYDYKTSMCESVTGCYISVEQSKDYKKIVSKNNSKTSYHFGINEWREVLEIFVLRIKCLFELSDISYDTYKKKINPEAIFNKEAELTANEDKIFILSSFPEFLFDYKKANFWNSFAKLKRMNYEKCIMESDNH